MKMKTLFSDLPMTKPTIEQIAEYAKSIGFALDAEYFYDYYQSIGWMVGKHPMKDWRAAVRTWRRRTSIKPEEPKKTKWSEKLSK